MSSANRRDWREICEQVVREKDSTRLNTLLEELLEALEEHARNRDPGRRKITDS